jgi:hypothetical protein
MRHILAYHIADQLEDKLYQKSLLYFFVYQLLLGYDNFKRLSDKADKLWIASSPHHHQDLTMGSGICCISWYVAREIFKGALLVAPLNLG